MILDKMANWKLSSAAWLVCLLAFFAVFKDGKGAINMKDDESLHNEIIHSDQRLLTSLEQKLMDEAPCVLCKFMMEKLEKTIESFIESFMSKEFDSECMKLVKNETICQDLAKKLDVAVDKLVGSLTPGYACKEAKFCDENMMKTVNIMQSVGLVKALAPNYKAGVICDLCKGFAQEVDDGLMWLLDQLKLYLDQLCSFLPDTTGQQCENLVKQYYAKLAQFISSQLNPNAICATDLHLC